MLFILKANEVTLTMKKWHIVTLVIIGIAVLYIFILVYQLCTTEIRQTKDYAEMFIEEGDMIDCSAILNPPEKYSQLLQIDTGIRQKLASYMEKNNYRLKYGKQEFVRNHPTADELINDFVFEKIE